VVPLDEQHTVAIVRAGAEPQGFGEQSIKSFPKIDPMSRQEDRKVVT